MLESITIKNFKKIQIERGLTLNNLSRVNYLVGENGCGKTSILSGIMLLERHFTSDTEIELNSMKITQKDRKAYVDSNIDYRSITYIDYKKQLDIDSEHSTHGHEEIIGNVTSQNPQTKQTQINRGIQTKQYQQKYKDFHLIEKIIGYIYPEKLEKIKSEIITYNPKMGSFNSKEARLSSDEFNELNPKARTLYEQKVSEIASGIRYLYCMMESIDLNLKNGKKIFIIEEPEIGLHPTAQKILPKYFNEIILGSPEIQFFITTHSPFVISAAAEYNDDQRVYLIEDGQTIDYKGPGLIKRAGLQTHNYIAGSNGYKPKHAIEISAKLLGAGLGDVLDNSEQIHKTNTIYLCESSNTDLNQMDESIYFELFPEHRFVSCGSCSDVVRNVAIMNQLRTTTNYVGIIDRDIDNDVLYNENENIKIIGRYNIESYLYDPNVIKNIGLGDFDEEEYRIAFEESNIIDSNEGHAASAQLKEFLRKYNESRPLSITNKELAEILFNNRTGDCKDIYNELYSIIFE